jgi:hypothetical protein
MRSKLTTLLTVIGAVTVLVLAANTVAMATTGKAILAGKINKATKLTSITRTTAGTGLQVKTKSTANAPLAVNGKGKVVNLNADTVDGLDSTRFTNTPYVVNKRLTVANTSHTVVLNVPVGTYLVNYSAYFTASPNASLGQVSCYLLSNNNGGTTVRFVGEEDIKTDVSSAGVSGSGVLTKNAGGNLTLNCITNVNSIQGFGDNQPVQIVLTKIDQVKPLAARVSNHRISK